MKSSRKLCLSGVVVYFGSFRSLSLFFFPCFQFMFYEKSYLRPYHSFFFWLLRGPGLGFGFGFSVCANWAGLGRGAGGFTVIRLID